MPVSALYLIPTPLSTEAAYPFPHSIGIIPEIAVFFVENVRTARRFISALQLNLPIDQLDFRVIDKDTKTGDLQELTAQLPTGRPIAYLSEAGCPGVADPGALLVKWAHEQGIQVVPLPGPSSIILALMASGLNGQHFTFHGYLPIDKADQQKVIRHLEVSSRKEHSTHIFIETPFRNEKLLEQLLATLSPDTRLCVACALQSPQELIISRKVRNWGNPPTLPPKQPAVFLFQA